MDILLGTIAFAIIVGIVLWKRQGKSPSKVATGWAPEDEERGKKL